MKAVKRHRPDVLYERYNLFLPAGVWLARKYKLPMLLEINAAMTAFEQDVAIRVVVLSGAGKGFSSGFDLKDQMERNPQGAKVWKEILQLDFDTTGTQIDLNTLCGTCQIHYHAVFIF